MNLNDCHKAFCEIELHLTLYAESREMHHVSKALDIAVKAKREIVRQVKKKEL